MNVLIGDMRGGGRGGDIPHVASGGQPLRNGRAESEGIIHMNRRRIGGGGRTPGEDKRGARQAGEAEEDPVNQHPHGGEWLRYAKQHVHLRSGM